MTDHTHTAKTPVIPISRADLIDVRLLAGPRLSCYPHSERPLTFSCNGVSVWPATRRGPVPEDERVDVEGASLLLSTIATLLRHDTRGRCGRFFVTDEGAFRSDNNSCICRFAIRD